MTSFHIKDLQLPSPIEHISSALIDQKNIKLMVKRDDMIHPWLSGNKWRKLKYNLNYAMSNDISTIVTFGGAFSNHLYATAGACALLNVKSVGIVRGEIDFNNPTIQFCKDRGMTLFPLSRSSYREKVLSTEVKNILAAYSDALVIPEGGANELAMQGVAEIWDELKLQLPAMPDYIVLPVGTGTTTAGLLGSNMFHTSIIAISVLKTGHLEGEINHLAKNKNSNKLFLSNDYHFGGYAKWTELLLKDIDLLEQDLFIPMDHVYNGKAFLGMTDLINKDYFKPGSSILYLHTGGLQGKKGLEYLRTINCT
ncbi:MAG: pyridoxal-phosphate dependent enzyme [Saprospiraceae bacterium]|nr:pyridoxal-phosphate dependent enzyme [Saprospiraceae bacterium]